MLFNDRRKKAAAKPAAPAKKPVKSTDQWISSMANDYKTSPAGKSASAAVDKKIAQNAWESNQSKMRAAGDAAWKAKYSKPEPKQKQSGGWVHAEGGRAINTERM